ncbi:hypothetical protein [Pantoea ananatis]|uniref:hypothetical protein n=1 Tax=Pantoea ananas TaxID=553 RepID=UPI001B3052E3|nr:hypothetical protein [Pantoea ananatis]
MNSFCRTFLVITLISGLSAGAFADGLVSVPVNDDDDCYKLDQLNTTAQIIDSRLQQISTLLSQSAQNGVCWQNGKSYSQGAKIVTEEGGTTATATCSVQEKTGWPAWKKDDVRVK